MNELIDFLIDRDVEYKRNTQLAHYSAVGIGGAADIIIFPNTKQKLVELIRRLSIDGTRFRILGNMSNVLLPDSESKTVFVSTRGIKGISISENEVLAECGALFSKLIIKAAESSLSGYENLFSIPGTVGAMLSMNAGAYGVTASDFFVSTSVFDIHSQKVEILTKNDVEFFYRGSSLRNDGYVVLDASFYLKSLSKEEILAKIADIRKKRKDAQPVYEKSLGSVFKRGKNYSAAYLIDRAGLKGARVGGISVSEKHAGFFVNDGTGTSAQFKKLVELVRGEVFSKFGVYLELEVEYVY